MKRLNLKATITTNHGAHVWVSGTPFRVIGRARVDPDLPGMDIRADGNCATFWGEGYEKVGDAIPYDDLPLAVRKALHSQRWTKRKFEQVELPDDFAGEPRYTLLGQALTRVTLHARNDTGFWLACQLRDERYSEAAALNTLGTYAQLVRHAGDPPYTEQEAYDSWRSALSQPARLPQGMRDEVEVRLVADVAEEKVDWLWRNRIPFRKVSIIEGDPDKGKSSITLYLAARVSRGEALPGGEDVECGAVLVICAEDDIADTVKPRLRVAGADEKIIGYIPLPLDEKGNVVPLTIPEDLGLIRKHVLGLERATHLPVRLVIIDPISAYLSEKISSNNDAQVRRAMAPLKELAGETSAAFLLVRHLNKDGNLRALYRGGGSIAFTASARSVLVVEKHPDNDSMYVLAAVKHNLSRAAESVAYYIQPDPKNPDVPVVAWGDPVDIDVATLLAGPDSRKDAPARKEAERFIRELLADGPMDSELAKKHADAAGISPSTLKKAKASLGVLSEKEYGSDGQIQKWLWTLPSYVDADGRIHLDGGDEEDEGDE